MTRPGASQRPTRSVLNGLHASPPVPLLGPEPSQPLTNLAAKPRRRSRASRPHHKDPPSPYKTVKEIAAYLKVGVDCIYEGCASRGLKHVKLGHSTIRLQLAWVDEWIDALMRRDEPL